MAIKKKVENLEKRTIDLTGPQGNAFYLLGMAGKWGKQLGLDVPKVMEEMQSSDYENLIEVFDKYFGSICDLER